jgi:predicted GNAT superfamily acetyltransferase
MNKYIALRIDDIDPAAAGNGADLDLLALNNTHARELSYLTPQRLGELIGKAFLAAKIGAAGAFLLAFDQSAAYDSENFLWFKKRFERFVYVDRVVVDSGHRGRGYARALYDRLFERAAAAGHERVVCEVNADPPNPASDAFHASYGFKPVGSGAIAGGMKTVSYYECAIAPAARL